MQFLIVEDDRFLALEIQRLCEKWGFVTVCAQNFQDLLIDFDRVKPDLILMDINLPKYDGFFWCEKIRTRSNVPILFLSSRNADADKILAMTSGGDEYIEKPFSNEVLIAKIKAILRRTYEYTITEKEYLTSEIYYDYDTNRFHVQQDSIELTKSEKKIMELLLKNRGKIITREEIAFELWQTDEFVSDTSLSVLVSRLRHKLSVLAGKKEIVQTKKGLGYLIP